MNYRRAVRLMLEGSDGHTVWLNSAAMAAAHIDRRTADPAGGKIEHNADGNPSGALRDNATLLGLGAMPPASLEYEASLLQTTSTRCARWASPPCRMPRRTIISWRCIKSSTMPSTSTCAVRGSLHLKDLKAPAARLIEEAKAFRSKWSCRSGTSSGPMR